MAFVCFPILSKSTRDNTTAFTLKKDVFYTETRRLLENTNSYYTFLYKKLKNAQWLTGNSKRDFYPGK